jgi:hypothetical protein
MSMKATPADQMIIESRDHVQPTFSTVTRVSAAVTFSEIADTHTHKKGN